jgi:hypothetical protein
LIDYYAKWIRKLILFFGWCAGVALIRTIVSGFRIFFGGRRPEDGTFFIVGGCFALLFAAMALWAWLASKTPNNSVEEKKWREFGDK